MFLQIDKAWYKLGLKPIELLVLAQVAEFNRNNKPCFKSNKAFAQDFSVSANTIDNALKSLEKQGYITRYDKHTQKGIDRTIVYNEEVVTAAITKIGFVEEPNTKIGFAETQNLDERKHKNCVIKDNTDKINPKDNFTKNFSSDDEFHF